MKSLTDEHVAKALGYVPYPWGGKKWCHWSKGKAKRILYPRHLMPKWTTSLDAIVQEIETRGLSWMVSTNAGAKTANKWFAQVEEHNPCANAGHPALALCMALLSSLEEKP